MKNASRVFWGLIFIAVAVFLVVTQLDLITVNLSIGTVLVGALCLAIFISSLFERSFGGIFVSLGLAYVCFGKMIGLPMISPWIVLVVVILLSAGFSLMFPNVKKKHPSNKDNAEKWAAYEDENQVGEHQKVESSDENGYIECSNTFGEIAKYVNTENLRGANLQNSFGQLKVYFDNAVIVNSPIEINVSNSFGSMQLFIPKDWHVEQNVRVFAGECLENNQNSGATTPTVRLIGTVNFGEIQITYV